MGVKALDRSGGELVSAIWYKHKNIAADGTVGQGKHIRVRFEQRVSRAISQPIRNLMTDEGAVLISTSFNYKYNKFDELLIAGRRWQVLDAQEDYDGDNQALAILSPKMRFRAYLALSALGDKEDE